jgi:hypothetical protein
MHADVHQDERSKNWPDLQIGDFVALRARGGTVYTGIVEDRTADGLIIWIRTGLNERKLFHMEDGYLPVARTPERFASGPPRGAGSPPQWFKHNP